MAENQNSLRRDRAGDDLFHDHWTEVLVADVPTEFFAVATETFYEKPRQLHKKHPELYDEMMEFYGLHPKEWFK